MDCKTVAIIGGGPAGCMCAYFAAKNGARVTIFEPKAPLYTILCTGGGRCNLAYAEYDFKELTKFYPRGEKFLYSIFSKFSTADTIDFFEKIGVETYTQDDLRIFPISNSATDVRDKVLDAIKKCEIKKEKVTKIEQYPRHAEFISASTQFAKDGKILKQVQDDANATNKFLITTKNKTYHFDKVVIAVGGHAGFALTEGFGHNIIEPKPALIGLISAENFKPIQGVSLKNIEAEIFCSDKKFTPIQDDMIFTHEGISGPLAYKISSVCARENYNKQNPLKITLDFCDNSKNIAILRFAQNDEIFDKVSFQKILDSNSQKDIKNLLFEFVPKSLAEYILNKNKIPFDKKCHEINGKTRDLIYKSLTEFEINVISPAKEGEVVTSGGVDLKEINSKDMQSKLVEGLYFCGEVIDVDGFCGGFNLQNCWSTGFVAGNNI